MRPLLFFVLLAVGCERPAACYRPESSSYGWKRVKLPQAAPHLAAPPTIDQLRTGEPAVVWGDWQRAEGSPRLGSTPYFINVESPAEVAELEFGARLGGAAVEVIGFRGGLSYTAMERRRLHENRVRLELVPRTSALRVIVHQHLRAAPTVSWRMGSRRALRPGRGWLYYFDPGEHPLELCEAAKRATGVRESRLEGEVVDVQLKPTLLTRLLPTPARRAPCALDGGARLPKRAKPASAASAAVGRLARLCRGRGACPLR